MVSYLVFILMMRMEFLLYFFLFLMCYKNIAHVAATPCVGAMPGRFCKISKSIFLFSLSLICSISC